MMGNGHLPAGRTGPGGAVGNGADMLGPEEQLAAGPVGGGPIAGGGGGGRGGGGRRARYYGAHYPNGRHNQNGYHGQNGFHGQNHNHSNHNSHSSHNSHNGHNSQFGHHNSHQLAQPPLYPHGYIPFMANPYAYAQMQPPYPQNSAISSYVPYPSQPYNRSMAGMPPQYPMMGPGGMAMSQAAPMHPHHTAMPPIPQHPLQHQPPPQPPHQPHMSLPHVSPFPKNASVVAPSSLPQQPLPPTLPVHPSLVPPAGLPPHLPLLPQHDVLQPPLPHMPLPQQPPVLSPTPSSSFSLHAVPTVMSPVASQQDSAASTAATLADTSSGPVNLAFESALASTASSTAAASTAPFRPPVSRSAYIHKITKFGDMSVSTDNFTRTQLPWLSCPDVPFPVKISKSRRRRKTMGEDLELPELNGATDSSSTAEPIERVDTPSTHELPSEAAPSTSPTTPSSVQATQQPVSSVTPTPLKSAVASPSASRAAVPILPAIPVRPVPEKPSTAAPSATVPADEQQQSSASDKPSTESAEDNAAAPSVTKPPSAPPAPKLWSNLFARGLGGAASSTAANGTADGEQIANGGTGAFSKAKANSLAEALSAYHVGSSGKVSFIEPRGLINTGNMCYMNSVLQILVFCTPFYDFLDQVSRKAAYSFKSETPLLDAMIMFIREFKIIDSADPADLRKRLKNEDLERYGDAFTPEFVYEAIKQLSRFESMRRGHQQDAEEFLGFMLECLNEECTKMMQDLPKAVTANDATPPASSDASGASSGEGWLEVGPRQRAAVTRSSGHASASPVNSIFGGKLRSELRVPGLKDSVTLEPYQSLQLDIDSPQVRNIVDALRGLTKPEVLHGDFGSPHGKDVSVTKQLFIETLPPVLILHLKRFQFDWQGNGTVKIWKKIGYPLELEIPREIFGRHKRNAYLSEPLPKYRLNGVVYHHGKQANGGHYTVDVLREDGREWIRLDDTVIRRIRSEDVAEAGAEEALPATNGSKQDTAASASTNGTSSATRFSGVSEEDGGDNDNDWRQVTAPVNGMKKWSSVANDGSVPKSKQQKENLKDNKVAYLLFYQRVN